MIEELKALRLDPGGLYAIEVQKPIGLTGMEALKTQLAEASEEFGVRLILLGPNLKIARDASEAR